MCKIYPTSRATRCGIAGADKQTGRFTAGNRPRSQPYGAKRSATLPVRVLYAGHALAGGLVKLTNLANDASPFEVRVTDRDGRASFTMPNAGAWLLNVIWTKPL